MPTIRQLQHARSIAQLGSFHLAATALHLSQPALTRSIQALETKLGLPIFDRLPHGAVPNKFGEAFLAKAHLLLLARDDLKREMLLLKGQEKTATRICLGPYLHDLLAPAAMAEMAATHPDLLCQVRLANWRDVSAQVLAREAEFGIADVGVLAADGRLVCEPLGQHALHFYCRAGHPFLGRTDLTLTEMATVPFVGTRAAVRMGPSLTRLRGHAGHTDETTGDFVPAWEVDSIALAKGIVKSSDVIGAATLVQIAPEIEQGVLALVPFRADWLTLSYGFMRRRDLIVSPGMNAFMAAFRKHESILSLAEDALTKRYL